jgi:hypothetical protein
MELKVLQNFLYFAVRKFAKGNKNLMKMKSNISRNFFGHPTTVGMPDLLASRQSGTGLNNINDARTCLFSD